MSVSVGYPIRAVDSLYVSKRKKKTEFQPIISIGRLLRVGKALSPVCEVYVLLSPFGSLGARRLSVHLQLQPEHKLFKHSSIEAMQR